MLENFHDALIANFRVIFFANEMDILGVDIDKIKLDDDNNNFCEDYHDITIMSDFWLGVTNLKNTKHLKKGR